MVSRCPSSFRRKRWKRQRFEAKGDFEQLDEQVGCGRKVSAVRLLPDDAAPTLNPGCGPDRLCGGTTSGNPFRCQPSGDAERPMELPYCQQVAENVDLIGVVDPEIHREQCEEQEEKDRTDAPCNECGGSQKRGYVCCRNSLQPGRFVEHEAVEFVGILLRKKPEVRGAAAGPFGIVFEKSRPLGESLAVIRPPQRAETGIKHLAPHGGCRTVDPFEHFVQIQIECRICVDALQGNCFFGAASVEIGADPVEIICHFPSGRRARSSEAGTEKLEGVHGLFRMVGYLRLRDLSS